MRKKVEMAEQHEDKEGFLRRSDMTLRDYFAGQALAGMLNSKALAYLSERVQADIAYKYADAMLEARK